MAGCARILIRKNNNLSKIYMICVFFPDRIYIGIIHQLAWHWPEESEENKNHKKQQPTQKQPLALSAASRSCAQQGPLTPPRELGLQRPRVGAPYPTSTQQHPPAAHAGQKLPVFPGSSSWAPAQKAPHQLTGTFGTCLGPGENTTPQQPHEPVPDPAGSQHHGQDGDVVAERQGPAAGTSPAGEPRDRGEMQKGFGKQLVKGQTEICYQCRTEIRLRLVNPLSNRSKRRLGSTPETSPPPGLALPAPRSVAHREEPGRAHPTPGRRDLLSPALLQRPFRLLLTRR